MPAEAFLVLTLKHKRGAAPVIIGADIMSESSDEATLVRKPSLTYVTAMTQKAMTYEDARNRLMDAIETHDDYRWCRKALKDKGTWAASKEEVKGALDMIADGDLLL